MQESCPYHSAGILDSFNIPYPSLFISWREVYIESINTTDVLERASQWEKQREVAKLLCSSEIYCWAFVFFYFFLFLIRLISQFALIWSRIVYSPGTSGTPWLCSLISILNLRALRLFAFSPRSIFQPEHSAKEPFRRNWGDVPELSWITLSRT